jgi:DNA repair protein RecO (recombination protein O)
MKQQLATGIVLTRVNYQEADRVISILTPEHGKLRVLAKGVRKSKSKLAGGVELFSVSEIGFILGRGELATLTSSRLIRHYGNIAQDIDRTMLGYELIKLLNKVTEDEPGAEYFDLLQTILESLDDSAVSAELIKLWFYAQLLKLAGHTPNLQTDIDKKPLDRAGSYLFSYDDMAFSADLNGPFAASHIKLLRLVFGHNKPTALQQVAGTDKILPACLQLVLTVFPNHLKV